VYFDYKLNFDLNDICGIWHVVAQLGDVVAQLGDVVAQL